MRYALTVKTAAAAEPVSTAQAKSHLRVEHDDDDTLIAGLVAAAREWVESYCRRSLVLRTYELRLDCWQPEIRLPRGPVTSVTHVKYVGADGVLATLAASSYQVDTHSVPARIVPAYGAVWPTLKPGELNAVLVEYVAGYAAGAGSPTDHAENVPAAAKAAIKLLVGHWYENREEVVLGAPPSTLPMAVKALLGPLEIRDFTLE